MSVGASLYDEDLVRWSEEQVAALRAAGASGSNLPVDWDHIAEEIDSLGKSQARELTSRTRTLVEHLLKLECSTAIEPRAGWKDTVRRTRLELDDLLAQSPSLRARLHETLQAVQAGTAASTADLLADPGDDPAPVHDRLSAGGYTPEEVFGSWFPKSKA